MGARIIDWSRVEARRRRARSAAPAPSSSNVDPLAESFLFWTGASGKRYVHTVHSLIGCPELPQANIILVRRDERGFRQVLRVGRVEDEAPSLNLADIRHTGAVLGANEVHVHLLGRTIGQRCAIEQDIAAAVEPNAVRLAVR